MFVSRLELLGFKSFAARTSLLFPEGLTAIVGPNGCGKSNIVDAIRWVLGEQRLSVLRCETLEQLIFNGSRGQKPLGMAEVTLTVENTQGILPIEFAQVVVTRRIYRSGESEYRLNGAPCRLRDIQELFMDTGFAAHSYSVIELRMVEELLNGRPEERRRLIEEAAGIGKYKVRHREAQRKLEQVQQDILRVEDLLTELRQRAATLQEQAEQARQWHHWNEERQKAERLLLLLQWHHFRHRLQQTEQRVEELHSAVARFRGQVEELRKELSAAEAQLAEWQATLQQSDEHRRQLSEHIHAVHLQQATVDERLRIAQSTIEQLRRERERIEQELARLRQRKQVMHQQLSELQSRYGELEHSYDAALRQVEMLRHQLQEWQNSIGPKRQQCEQRRQELFQLRLHHEHLHARLELLARQEEQLQKERQQLSQRRAEQERIRQQLYEELHRQREQCEKLQQQLQERQERAVYVAEQLRHHQQRREQVHQEVATLKARQQWLESLLSEHTLLQVLQVVAPEMEPELLAEHVIVPEQLQKAFAAAIGVFLEVPVVKGEGVGTWFERLRSEVQSGAFFLLSPLVSSEEAASAPLPMPAVLGWLWDMISMPAPLTTALRAVIGEVAVVESLSAGRALLEQRYADAVVTLDGLFLHRCGLVCWSSGEAQSPWIGRRRVLEELTHRLGLLQEEAYHLEMEEAELQQQLHVADPEPLRKALAATEQRFQELRIRLEQAQNRIEELERAEQERHQQERQVHTERTAAMERTQQLALQIESLQQEWDMLSREVSSAQAMEERLRAELEAAHQRWRQQEREWLACRHRIETAQQALHEIERRIEQLERRQRQVIAEIATAEELEANLRKESEALRQQRKALQEQWQQEEEHITHLRQQEEQLRRHCAELRQQVEEQQRELQVYQLQLHEAELQREHLQTQLGNITEQFCARFASEPETLQLPDTPPSINRLQQQIRTATRQLEALGAVNFRALQEYDELCQRLRFLEAQYADLQQAAQSLRQLIEETHRIALQRFMATFEQVRRNFQRLFGLLFDEGDEADLRLGDGSPLEASIEIIAKPRGKRPQVLEQLSGGEKTLVALSLLFAIYLVKPSPFCVLDEVDAPLDDANIDRFLRLLRSFSETTQFLLITHNKRTMEAVDTLYGVTMQPEGVSKVLAVRLRSGELVR